jgi:dihydroxyacetone kinase
LGAGAAEGLHLDAVERVGRAANAATRTLGVAFSGCTMPGEEQPLFTVPDGHLGLGLGIHGEPGIRDVAMLPAAELAALLVDELVKAAPRASGRRVAPILNGLGTTKYEELFLLWGHVAARLRDAGYEIVDPEVGELVTSLDMGGCSLTVMWLDDELERLWRADAYTPAYRKATAPLRALRAPGPAEGTDVAAVVTAPEATGAARELAGRVLAGLRATAGTLAEHEQELGRIDAVAGDGDHGRGMVKGASAALDRAEAVVPGAGASWLLQQAGQAWAEHAGGTSGVLWGAALEAAGRALDDTDDGFSTADAAASAHAFAEAVSGLGGARLGDKTMLDALLPFLDELDSRLGSGSGLADAWRAAATTATESARYTADLRPKVGRARPLAEKSLGTPDAGATSLALVAHAVADSLAVEHDGRKNGNA